MTKPRDVTVPEIETEPFAHGPCETCGSKEWANANLSPATFLPITCDRCPEKKADQIIHEAEQHIF